LSPLLQRIMDLSIFTLSAEVDQIQIHLPDLPHASPHHPQAPPLSLSFASFTIALCFFYLILLNPVYVSQTKFTSNPFAPTL